MAGPASLVAQSSLCTRGGDTSTILSPVLKLDRYSTKHLFQLPANAKDITIAVRQAGDFESSTEYTTLMIDEFNIVQKCSTSQSDWSGGTCATPIPLVTTSETTQEIAFEAALRKSNSVHKSGSGMYGAADTAAIMIVSYTCQTAERPAPNGVLFVSGKADKSRSVEYDFTFPDWTISTGCTARVNVEQFGDLDSDSE